MLERVKAYFQNDPNISSIEEHDGRITVLVKDIGLADPEKLEKAHGVDSVRVLRNKLIIERKDKKMAANYNEIADQIVNLVGGKDNIAFFTHCVTRLRFNVKDESKVNKDGVDKLPSVLGSQWQNGQLQVIIGQAVGDVYKLVCEKKDLVFVEEDMIVPDSKPDILNSIS